MGGNQEKLDQLSGSDSHILSEFGWNHYSDDAIFNHFDSSSSDLVTTSGYGYGVSNHIDQPPTMKMENNNIAGEKVSAVSSESTPSASDSYQPSNTSLSKTKQKGKKGPRAPRIAFVTKSEVDNLEDGYRWRKYGQKPVKNSSFPRSYYRCTNSKCIVKKRVERSGQDPAVVITTYEGQHCHHSIGFVPLLPQDAALFPPNVPAGSLYYPTLPFPQQNIAGYENHAPGRDGESRRIPDTSGVVSLGQGLLGDIVPPLMRNP